jgi:hypothetical protein
MLNAADLPNDIEALKAMLLAHEAALVARDAALAASEAKVAHRRDRAFEAGTGEVEAHAVRPSV